MEYEKAFAIVVDFEDEDIVVSSTNCGQTQYDAEICDGQTQAVTKPF